MDESMQTRITRYAMDALELYGVDDDVVSLS